MNAPDWKNPSEKDLAALRTVHERLGRQNIHRYVALYGLNDTALAGVVLNAESMLWFQQTKGWITAPPRLQDDLTTVLFQQGARLTVEWISTGYNAEHGMYWVPPAIWPASPSMRELVVGDFFAMVEQLRIQSDLAISAGFPVVADLLLGRGWQRDHNTRIALLGQHLGLSVRPATLHREDGDGTT